MADSWQCPLLSLSAKIIVRSSSTHVFFAIVKVLPLAVALNSPASLENKTPHMYPTISYNATPKCKKRNDQNLS